MELARENTARSGSGQPESEAAKPGWICFSGQDWWYHNRAHSDFQLLRRVAKQRPLLFVNSIGMRMPAPGRSTQVARRILRKAASVARFLKQPLEDTPNFHVLTPVILPFYGSKTMRALNARLVRTQVRLVARWIGIDPDDAVLFVTIPTAADVVRRLAASLADCQSLGSPLGIRGGQPGPHSRLGNRARRQQRRRSLYVPLADEYRRVPIAVSERCSSTTASTTTALRQRQAPSPRPRGDPPAHRRVLRRHRRLRRRSRSTQEGRRGPAPLLARAHW